MGKRFVFDDGPWTFEKVDDYYNIKADDIVIAKIHSDNGQNALANARVISATPDIFQALLCFLTIYGDSDILQEINDERLSLAITAAKLALLKTARANPDGVD